MTNKELIEDIVSTCFFDDTASIKKEEERILNLMVSYGKYCALEYHKEMIRTGSSNVESVSRLFNFLSLKNE